MMMSVVPPIHTCRHPDARITMDDEKAAAEIEELMKQLEEQEKLIQKGTNQIKKLDALSKKALQGGKKVDEILK
jgi:hypothetical protein